MTLLVAGEVLMEKVIRRFTLQEIIKKKSIPQKTLFENISQYPTKGVGFRVWRKTWPRNSYYTIVDVDFKDLSKGQAYGVLTWNGRVQGDKPERIRNGLKRGVWRINMMNSFIRTDNGLYYSPEDMEKLMNGTSLKESNLRVYGKETRPSYAQSQETAQPKAAPKASQTKANK